MAGIGFKISRLLNSDDLYSKIGGVIASIFLSCGPWLCTLLGIAGLSLVTPENENPFNRQVFRVLVNYIFMFSLVGFSFLEMVVTRYVADAIYTRQEKVIPTLFCSLILIIFAVMAGIGGNFFPLIGLGWRVSLVATVLLCVVTINWCTMIFLSACKDYLWITLSFIGGMCVSLGATYMLGNWFQLGIVGKLLGFTAGQVFIATSMTHHIFKEFGIRSLPLRDFGVHCVKHYYYILAGVFYSMAIWIDKIIFWTEPKTAELVAPYLYKSSAYEAGIFLSYLFVVPSMSYFLVQMETSFYTAYRSYFARIDKGAPLNLIEKGRVEVIQVIRRNIAGLLVFQSFVSIPAFFLAPQFMDWVGLPTYYATVFRYGLIGSAAHIFFLFANILLFYFDLPKLVARNYGIFFLLNAALTFLSVRYDYRFHGLGYAVAAVLALFISLLTLNKMVRKTNFSIFMKQPLAKPQTLSFAMDTVSLK